MLKCYNYKHMLLPRFALQIMSLTIITNGVFNGEQEIENTGECLLISSLPHKALRTIIDIARLAEIKRILVSVF